VGIESRVDLLVAALDLKLVQLVRQAMRAADQHRGGSLPLGPAPSPEPRPRIHPEAQFDPRRVIHPTPRFEPRPVIHPEPRFEQERLACDRRADTREVVVHTSPAELPLQPPWKTIPWENPAPPAPKIKVARPHPDIIHKGLLLDFFI